MRINCDFHYDSAHFLTKVPVGHKCARHHGHTYQLTVTIEGEVGENGFVSDFADVKNAVSPLIEQLDHRLLNTIPGLENPSVEVQLQWLWQRIDLPGLFELSLREGLNNSASYRGD